jgi:hypothetical protein
MRSGLSGVIVSAFLVLPGAALAHPGHGGDRGLVHELEHLLGGHDPALAIALIGAGAIALGFAVTLRARRARSSPLRP